jgi:hypothetical protein
MVVAAMVVVVTEVAETVVVAKAGVKAEVVTAVATAEHHSLRQHSSVPHATW